MNCMARKPENIHVYLYRKNANNEIEYAIFQRSDNAECWQGISGGVEDGETPKQAASREAFEEAGCPQTLVILFKEEQKQQKGDKNEKLQADIFRMKEFIIDFVKREPNPVVIGPHIREAIQKAGYDCDFYVISIVEYNKRKKND